MLVVYIITGVIAQIPLVILILLIVRAYKAKDKRLLYNSYIYVGAYFLAMYSFLHWIKQ